MSDENFLKKHGERGLIFSALSAVVLYGGIRVESGLATTVNTLAKAQTAILVKVDNNDGRLDERTSRIRNLEKQTAVLTTKVQAQAVELAGLKARRSIADTRLRNVEQGAAVERGRATARYEAILRSLKLIHQRLDKLQDKRRIGPSP